MTPQIARQSQTKILIKGHAHGSRTLNLEHIVIRDIWRISHGSLEKLAIKTIRCECQEIGLEKIAPVNFLWDQFIQILCKGGGFYVAAKNALPRSRRSQLIKTMLQ